jgi:hypothetical protein
MGFRSNQNSRIIVIVLLMFIMLLNSGCTVAGYRMGEFEDRSSPYVIQEYFLPGNSIELHLNDRVSGVLKSGEKFYGRILKIGDFRYNRFDLIVGTDDNIQLIDYDQIKVLRTLKYPIKNRVIGSLSGCLSDTVILAVLAVVSVFSFILSIGPINL